MISIKKAYLVLQNGTVFEGKSFGKSADAIGELVFSTNMVGCLETLTDPAYYGQIVIQTFPSIGNYGLVKEDLESSNAQVSGYVVRDWCEHPSNFKCEGDIDSFLKENNVVGIYGIDTRELTRILRDNGTMNAKIVSELSDSIADELNACTIKDAVKTVGAKEIKTCPAQDKPLYKVVMMDLGAKRSMINELTKRGCEVTVVPYNTPADEISAMQPDGMLLSSGAGDPMEIPEAVQTAKVLMGSIPMFGIGLGHQIMALSVGAKTEKLKYGHRGDNQPVKETSTGKTLITSQNHGYCVAADSVDGTKAVVSFANANDNTCEGLDYPELNAFSVQFYPATYTGPLNKRTLYDRFIDMMGGNK